MSTLSQTENKILMTNARDSLRGNWGLAIGGFVVFVLVIGGVQIIPVAGIIASILISGPITVGAVRFTLSISRKQEAQIGQIFSGFDRFGEHLLAYILQFIFVILWTLLLIIPGIIAGLSYSMTYFILAEDSSISASDAITKSKQMMQGNKGKLFCLGCRFIGWSLLASLTLGIGYLWVGPYMYVSIAQFYDDLKESNTEEPEFA